MTFSDKALLENVENARHALSLEDDRKPSIRFPVTKRRRKTSSKMGG
jgi:hypothetical protein